MTESSIPSAAVREAEWAPAEAAYLAANPQIQAAVPKWATTLEVEEIDDELEGTIFSFRGEWGEVELYGVGRMKGGEVSTTGADAPNLYLPNEIEVSSAADLRSIAADLLMAADAFEAATSGEPEGNS